MVEKLFPDPFLKNQNWPYVWINILKSYIFCCYCLPNWGLSKVVKTKLQTTCFYLIYRLFKIQKEILELVSLPHFRYGFWRKVFLLLYSITWPIFNVWLSLPREILGNMYIVIVSQPGCDVKNFKINLFFLIKPFLLHHQKIKTKI